MPVAKYFEAISAAQPAPAAGSTARLEPFDFAMLGEKARLGRWQAALSLRLLGPLYALARRFRPVMPLAGFTHVTGAAQVREVLLRTADFIVPFGPEMAELGEGAPFIAALRTSGLP